jgi:hypothetical protein
MSISSSSPRTWYSLWILLAPPTIRRSQQGYRSQRDKPRYSPLVLLIYCSIPCQKPLFLCERNQYQGNDAHRRCHQGQAGACQKTPPDQCRNESYILRIPREPVRPSTYQRALASKAGCRANSPHSMMPSTPTPTAEAKNKNHIKYFGQARCRGGGQILHCGKTMLTTTQTAASVSVASVA